MLCSIKKISYLVAKWCNFPMKHGCIIFKRKIITLVWDVILWKWFVESLNNILRYIKLSPGNMYTYETFTSVQYMIHHINILWFFFSTFFLGLELKEALENFHCLSCTIGSLYGKALIQEWKIWKSMKRLQSVDNKFFLA